MQNEREVYMPNSVKTFLMFEGNAEEAMGFYVSLFEHSEVLHVENSVGSTTALVFRGNLT